MGGDHTIGGGLSTRRHGTIYIHVSVYIYICIYLCMFLCLFMEEGLADPESSGTTIVWGYFIDRLVASGSIGF